MKINVIPLERKIGGLYAWSVEPAPCETLPKEFDWYAVRNAIDDNFIKTDSDAGSVGVIYGDMVDGVFNDAMVYRVPNFRGDGLTRVGVVDSLPDDLKGQMHYMGMYHGKHLWISDYDCDVIPRTDLEIDREAWYACYSRDGIVVFVKV